MSDPSTLPVFKTKWVVAICVAILIAIIAYTDGGDLVDHVPLIYAIIWLLLGVYSWLRVCIWIHRVKDSASVNYVGSFSLLVIVLLLAPSMGRQLYQIIGFAGVEPLEIQSTGSIVGMSAGKSGLRAIVKMSPDSREIWVGVTSDLFDRLDAVRYPGRDCLKMTVQTGRFGIRRAVVPRHFGHQIDLDQLESCPAEVASWNDR